MTEYPNTIWANQAYYYIGMCHFQRRSWSNAIEALNLVNLLGFGGIALVAARRLPAAYALYTLPSLALLFTHVGYISPLGSASRYVLVLFPCFIFLAMWLSTRRWMAIAWLSVSAILLLLLFQFWARWGFVG